MRAPDELAREMIVSTKSGPVLFDSGEQLRIGSAETARKMLARIIARFRAEGAAEERSKVDRLLGRVCRAWLVEQRLPDPYEGIKFEGITVREGSDDWDPDPLDHSTREDLGKAQLAVEADLLHRGLIDPHGEEDSLSIAGRELVEQLEREEEEYERESERLRKLAEERPPSRRKKRLQAVA